MSNGHRPVAQKAKPTATPTPSPTMTIPIPLPEVLAPQGPTVPTGPRDMDLATQQFYEQQGPIPVQGPVPVPVQADQWTKETEWVGKSPVQLLTGIFHLMGEGAHVAAEGALGIGLGSMWRPEYWLPSSIPGLSEGEAKVYRAVQNWTAEHDGKKPNLSEFTDISQEALDYPPYVRGISQLIFDPLNFTPAKIFNIPMPMGGIDYASLLKPKSTLTAAMDEVLEKNLRSAQNATTVAKNSGRLGLGEAVTRVSVPNIPAVQNMLDLLKKAKPVLKKQQNDYKVERAKRVQAFQARMLEEVEVLGGRGSIDANVYRDAIKETMGGELPKAAWTPLMEGATPLDRRDYDTLMRYVKDFSGDDGFEYINNMNSFLALVEGSTVPQAKQLKRLEAMFGSDITDIVGEKAGWGTKLWSGTMDMLGLPRTVISSYDLSAPLRQGRVMGYAYPKEWSDAFVTMHKILLSEEGAQIVEQNIRNHPYFGMAENAGLFYAERGAKVASGTAQREERFVSRLASSWIPGVKESERAYATFLNKFRHDVFYRTVAEWEAAGVIAQKSAEDFKDLATMINWGTGRGPIPNFGNRAADVLSALFFAPRFVTSGPSFLVGGATKSLMNRNAGASKVWARSMVGFVQSSLMWLEKLSVMGAEVELDPRSSDFGKGKLGKHRFDFFGGWLPTSRYVAQWLLAERKPLAGGKFATAIEADRKEIFGRFVQSKMSPSGGLGRDAIAGEDFLGAEVSGVQLRSPQFWIDRITPMFIADLHDAIKVYQDPMAIFQGSPSIPGTLFSVYGGGFQSFETALDVKNEVAGIVAPGTVYDDHIPGSQIRQRIDSHPFVQDYYDEREAKVPAPKSQSEWQNGIRQYADRVKMLEEGNPASDDPVLRDGYVKTVMNEPPGENRRTWIRNYLSDKYNTWRTAITSGAEGWYQAQKESRWANPELIKTLYRDKYWSITAPVILDSEGRPTTRVDYRRKDRRRDEVIKQAVRNGIVKANPDGTPDTTDPNLMFITRRSQIAYEDDPEKGPFAEAVMEYQNDMDFLADNYWSLERTVLEREGAWDAYVDYLGATGIDGEIRKIDKRFDDAMTKVTDTKRAARSMGWDDGPRLPDRRVVSQEQKDTARRVSELLLKWGFLPLESLPPDLLAVLGPQHAMRNERYLQRAGERMGGGQ